MAVKNDLKIFRPVQVNGLKRLGNRFDGGYIVHGPSLADVEVLINYGVGYNVKFEKDFFKETGAPTLAFDPTLKSIRPIADKLKNGQFIPFLRHLKNYITWKFQESSLPAFHIKYVEEGLSGNDRGEYKTLLYHYNHYGLHEKKSILKIDIEGAEYEVFNDKSVYPLLSNTLQVIIEFHDLAQHMEELITIMTELSKTHALIHIHANNHANTFSFYETAIPGAIEVTFLSNKYLPNKVPSLSSYPIPGLDSPCHKLKADIPLNFF